MGHPLFSVAVSEIEQDVQERSWEIPTSWIESALEGTEASHTGKTGHLTAQLMKNSGRYLVRGKIRVQLQVPCARTLDPAVYDLTPEIFLMLKRDEPASPATRPRASRSRNKDDDDDDALTEEDAAFDTFSGETLHLDPFVREQMLLELPMFPLRSDLRSAQSPPIGAPPQTSESAESPHGSTLDPRLAPLKRIAEQMRQAQPAEAKKTPVKK
jgi:uncharacterized protein